MDIYVESILNSHRVMAECGRIRLLLAAFTDIGVARNFRDWAIDTLPKDDLWQLMYRGKHRYRLSDESRTLAELILQRRQHPAADTLYYAELAKERESHRE